MNKCCVPNVACSDRNFMGYCMAFQNVCPYFVKALQDYVPDDVDSDDPPSNLPGGGVVEGAPSEAIHHINLSQPSISQPSQNNISISQPSQPINFDTSHISLSANTIATGEAFHPISQLSHNDIEHLIDATTLRLARRVNEGEEIPTDAPKEPCAIPKINVSRDAEVNWKQLCEACEHEKQSLGIIRWLNAAGSGTRELTARYELAEPLYDEFYASLRANMLFLKKKSPLFFIYQEVNFRGRRHVEVVEPIRQETLLVNASFLIKDCRVISVPQTSFAIHEGTLLRAVPYGMAFKCKVEPNVGEVYLNCFPHPQNPFWLVMVSADFEHYCVVHRAEENFKQSFEELAASGCKGYLKEIFIDQEAMEKKDSRSWREEMIEKINAGLKKGG